MRSVHVVAVGAVATASLMICCGWPYEVGSLPPDAEVDSGALADSIVPYDVPSASCADAGLKSGEAVACGCGGDGGVTDAEGGVTGHSTCTLTGEMGPCVGCPSESSCDSVTSPPGMICIPGGITTLGAKNAAVCPPEGCPLEGPTHAVAVSRFFLDEREVTVKRFRDWWSAGHVPPKAGDVVYKAGDGITISWSEAWKVTEPTLGDGSNGATWRGEAATSNDPLPINFVDWPTALAFCMSSGGRLPTEAEWEAAASGREGRLFPREPAETRNAQPTRAMLPCLRAISAAGAEDCGPPAPPTGTSERYSRDGVYDLVGSVAEWVLDVQPPGGLACAANCYPTAPSVDWVLFVPEIDFRGIRGGAWNDSDPKVLRVQARDFKPSTTKTVTIGFRCAKR